MIKKHLKTIIFIIILAMLFSTTVFAIDPSTLDISPIARGETVRRSSVLLKSFTLLLTISAIISIPLCIVFGIISLKNNKSSKAKGIIILLIPVFIIILTFVLRFILI